MFRDGRSARREHLPRLGFSLSEMLIASALFATFIILFARFFSKGNKYMVEAQLSNRSQSDIRKAMATIEQDLGEMVHIATAARSEIVFFMDGHRLPAYTSDGDWDADGVPNIEDDDVDGDLNRIEPPATRWQVGYNIVDDDDNDDGGRDVQCKYYMQGGVLFRDFNYDEQGWGLNKTEVLTNVPSDGFQCTYFGNPHEPLGAKIDLGDDGVAGGAGPGENDGIISEREIDWVKPSDGGHGNRSGSLDKQVERDYVFLLRVRLAQDRNRDGRADFQLQTEISPPMIPVRRNLL